MMSEQEYRNEDGLNYSELARFNQAPDHCLLPCHYQPYFETGHQFEMLLQDNVTGSNIFNRDYFVTNLNSDIPSKVLQCLKNQDDLMQLEVLTKAGIRSKTYQNTHDYIDVCLQNKGKIPVSAKDFNMLNEMVFNMLKMPVVGRPLGDWLQKAQWQVPMFWENDGIEKKALADIIIELPERVFIMDLKTTADLSRFGYMVKDKYWIQDVHYCEGVEEVFNKPCTPMIFLASEKKTPFLAQAFSLSEESRNKKLKAYERLCMRYQEWADSGKPKIGWIESKEVWC